MPAKPFQRLKVYELQYARNLRKIAKVVGLIIQQNTAGGELIHASNMVRLYEQLKAYSETIEPWAKITAAKMFEAVSAYNKKSFLALRHSKRIAEGLKDMLANQGVGYAAKGWQMGQVELIKSLPIDAAQRAQALALKAAQGGERPEAIAARIQASGDVTSARATMIARTEISKANAAITKARAEFVGAKQYWWRTMQDGNVRPGHLEMEAAGEPYTFSDPPAVYDAKGEYEGNYNPGEFPNCRCYAEPILEPD